MPARNKSTLCLIFSIHALLSFSQPGSFVASLKRNDGVVIPFTFRQQQQNGKQYWVIKNAAERIKVTAMVHIADSLMVQMPVFESQFRLIQKGRFYTGLWIKNGARNNTILPFEAAPGSRFTKTNRASFNITGRWSVHFSSHKKGESSVGEFVQKGDHLTGTFLNASGDYRFLEGVVSGDSMFLSGFDGGHAYLFTAKIENKKTITGGTFFSGATYKESWNAIKDSRASVPLESVAMYLKPGEEQLHFHFKNLQGNEVSIADEKFKNKVVVVQLMGSWCPNCMDETAFLSDYYNHNKHRGVEVIALAYEYSTDWGRSIKSLEKFRLRYNVQYTVLNTGVAVTDSLRTEKTLPELTPIKVFPSSIIIDKKGKVRKLDTGFNGPATGEHHTLYKREFEELVDGLLKE